MCLKFVDRLIRCGEYSSISIGVAYIVVPHCRLVVSYDPLQLWKGIQLTPHRQRKGRKGSDLLLHRQTSLVVVD